jgi:hypothetical protein
MSAGLPTPAAIVAHLDRRVHGQARAKRDLAVAVYNHYLSQAYRERDGVDLGKHHILLIGPTGVGKTYLVKTLADYLGVPIGFTSAAGLVEAGYKGNSVETLISALLDRAGVIPSVRRRASSSSTRLTRSDGGRRAFAMSAERVSRTRCSRCWTEGCRRGWKGARTPPWTRAGCSSSVRVPSWG